MIDTQYFGYGVGLVMVGWMVGVVMNIVFKIIKQITVLGLAICLLSFNSGTAEAATTANCPSALDNESAVKITYRCGATNTNGRIVYVNGIYDNSAQTFYWRSGDNSTQRTFITNPNAAGQAGLIASSSQGGEVITILSCTSYANPNLMTPTDYWQIASFMVGTFAAMAFVIACAMRHE